MQEPLYKDLQKLLRYRCDYFTSEQKAINIYSDVTRVSEDEENEIKRKVSRYFGTDEYKQLCDIIDLCKKATAIDFDIGILFHLIKESDPQEYAQLSEVLLSECSSSISEETYDNNQKFLATISIQYYQLNEEESGKSYDYLELSAKLQSLDTEINTKKNALDQRLNEIMMKR